jgi:gallate dioxygenase
VARILGALACSHTPTIGFAFDRKTREDPTWGPIFRVFVICNDHATSFFFDHDSAFALGIDERYEVADEFDMSFFQDKPLDHGVFSPLSMLAPHAPDWPAAIVPLQVGVLQFPMPTARRCTSWDTPCAARSKVIQRI